MQDKDVISIEHRDTLPISFDELDNRWLPKDKLTVEEFKKICTCKFLELSKAEQQAELNKLINKLKRRQLYNQPQQVNYSYAESLDTNELEQIFPEVDEK